MEYNANDAFNANTNNKKREMIHKIYTREGGGEVLGWRFRGNGFVCCRCLFKYIALAVHGNLEDTLVVGRMMAVLMVIMPNSMPLLQIYGEKQRKTQTLDFPLFQTMILTESTKYKSLKDTYSSSGQLIGCANR